MVTQGTTQLIAKGGGISFGSAATINSTSTQTITVTNTGASTLTLSALKATGNFTISTGFGSSSLAAGASTTFVAKMTTTSGGNKTGTVTFTDNVTGLTSYTFNVTGTVSAPAMVVKQGSTTVTNGGTFNSGTANLGASDTLTFTISNPAAVER